MENENKREKNFWACSVQRDGTQHPFNENWSEYKKQRTLRNIDVDDDDDDNDDDNDD